MIAVSAVDLHSGYAIPAVVRSLLFRMEGAPSSGSHSEQGGETENRLAAIIKGCRKSDEKSFELLYKQFYGYAYSIAVKYCINRDDTIEVVNDSFMKVFDNIHKYDLEKPFKPWFRRIVVNTSIDRIRKHRGDHLDIDEVPISGSMHVEEELTVKETLNLLEELPEVYRAVFNLYEVDGYSHREISKKLGIGESSSRTYLMRARHRLQSLYTQYFTGKSYKDATSGSN
jgi:RNA polymerase sigma factor (sigma-70 family)